MKKILSLVLALVMAFGSYSFGAMDTTEGYDAVGNELKGLGIIQGADEGALNSLSKLTRQDAIVILSRLMGKESDAKETKAQSGYADVPAGFYEPYIAYAKAMNWTNGVSENKFGFGEDVTAKQFVTFALRGLGYTVDWATEDVMKKATELGLLQDVNASENAPIIRGEVFKVMKNTLYTVPNGGDKKLVYVLGLMDESTGEVLPDPEKPVVTGELEVVDVKATNLVQVTVEFNQAVKRDSVKKGTTLVYNGVKEVDLDETGTIATITVNNQLTNNKDYKITLNGVEAVDGAKLEKVVKEFKAMDVEVPVAEELKVVGPREVEITFSEPLKSKPEVRVKTDKSSWFTGSVKDFTAGDAKVKVSANSFKEGTTYRVLVSKAEDYAGYSNIDKIFEFEYAKDNNAPVLTVEKADQKKVVVTFDKPVKGLSVKNFYHTYSGWIAKGIYKDAEMTLAKKVNPSDSVSKVYIEFADAATGTGNYPLRAGEVKFYAVGSSNGVKVVDNWGNQLQDTMIMLDVDADTTAPVAEKAELKADNKVTITFSEDVTVKRENFELLDNNGKKLSGVGFELDPANAESNEQTVRILGSDLDGKTFVLNVSGAEDTSLAQNKMVGVASFTITFEDKTFKGVEKAFLLEKDGYASLMVEFKEAVDPETATDAKNYRFSFNESGDKQFTLSTDVTMYNDKTVKFDLGKTSDEDSVYKKKKFDEFTSDKGRVFVSNKIKDLNGNSPSEFEIEADFEKTAGPISTLQAAVKSVKAVSKTELEVTFEKNVQSDNIDLNKFEVSSASFAGDKKPALVELVNSKKLRVELAEDNALLTNAKDVVLKIAEGSGLKDNLDRTLTGAFTSTEVKDGIAPELLTLPESKDAKIYASTGGAFTHDKDTVGRPAMKVVNNDDKYTLEVYFSEAIDKNSLSSNTFELTGNWEIKQTVWARDEVAPAFDDATQTGKIVFEIAPKKDENYFGSLGVKVGEVSDLAGNKLAATDTRFIASELMKKFTKENIASNNELGKARRALGELITEAKKYKGEDYKFEAMTSASDQGKYYIQVALKADFEAKLSAAETEKDKAEATKDSLDAAKAALKIEVDKVKEDVKRVAPVLDFAESNVSKPKGEVSVDFENKAKVADAKDTYKYLALNNDDVYYTEGQEVASLSLQDLVAVGSDKAFDLSSNTKVVLFDVKDGKVVSYKKLGNLNDKKGVLVAEANPAKVETGGSNPATVESSPVTLSSGENTPVTVNSFVASTNAKIKITVTPSSGNVEIKTTGEGVASAATATSGEDYELLGTGELKVKAVISESDKISRVYEATVTVNP